MSKKCQTISKQYSNNRRTFALNVKPFSKYIDLLLYLQPEKTVLPMNILSLQITGGNFEAILKGVQKIETRKILPNTIKKYFTRPNTKEMQVIKYDALRLINGRTHPIPELTVQVLKEEVVFETDEKGNEITYIDDQTGEECVLCFIAYHLGEIIDQKNTEKFFDENRPPLTDNFVKEEELI